MVPDVLLCIPHRLEDQKLTFVKWVCKSICKHQQAALGWSLDFWFSLKFQVFLQVNVKIVGQVLNNPCIRIDDGQNKRIAQIFNLLIIREELDGSDDLLTLLTDKLFVYFCATS
jgi:hypothetical protein